MTALEVHRFSAYVTEGPALPADHPDGLQQRALARAVARLGGRHQLAYCTAATCCWFVRTPKRLDNAYELAFTHVSFVHWDALLDGRASIDPDLVDGGREHLAQRMQSVPKRLRPAFADLFPRVVP